MSENEIKTLNFKRGQLKKHLTRFSNYLNNIDHQTTTVSEIKTRLSKIDSLLTEFENINHQIFALDQSLENELNNEYDLFEESYFTTVASAQRLITQKTSPTNEQGNITQSKMHINLPVINLPKFDGTYENWLSFFETFESVIHNNNELSEIQKFHYLKSSLSDNASHVINSLGASADNYNTAIELLKNRYENKRLIVSAHINALFDMPVTNKQSSSSLQILIDKVNLHLRALSSLKINTESWDLMIIHLITNKLDFHTRREWELKATKELPTMEEMTTFLNQRCQVLSSIERNRTPQSEINQKQSTNRKDTHKRDTQKLLMHHTAVTKTSCPVCNQTHHIYQCNQFLENNVHERIKLIKKLKLCINCLRGNHMSSSCQLGNCRKCNQKHNTLLHIPTHQVEDPTTSSSSTSNGISSDNVNNQNAITTPTLANLTYQQNLNSEVLLSTVVIHILNKKGQPIQCRALLDVGSQSNFITESFTKKLGLTIKNVTLPITGISQSVTYANKLINITLKSIYNSFSAAVTCLVLPKITEDLPQRFISRSTCKIPSNITLADPEFNKPAPIDLLIGAELFWEILCVGQIKQYGQPLLQKTQFGWVTGGTYNHNKLPASVISNISLNADLNQTLNKFWQLEEVMVKNENYTSEEIKCEEQFKRDYSRNTDGRFIVKLPFKENIQTLGSSKETALNRFTSLEQKFSKNYEFKLQYAAFMSEYLLLGHMEQVRATEVDKTNDVFYLPHHGVMKNSSITTKLRVVFDGSAKTTTGASLNDNLMIGPLLQQELFNIIVRFRIFKYVLTADITKMYIQILIHPDHKDLQRILWRPDNSSEIQTYRLNTVTYGTTSAPYLAIKCLQLAHDNKQQYPEVYEVIMRDFYVDDCLTGSNSIKQLKILRDDLNTVLKSGGFTLSKWSSNVPQLIQDNKHDNNIININNDGNTKTLGLLRNTSTDAFKFVFNQLNHKRVTKRAILSTIAQIFDPLGLIAPVVVRAKILMQQLWCLKINWDESLPIHHFTQWSTILADFNNVNNITISRYVTSLHNIKYFELHGFCDSSEAAYGACIYIRSVSSSNHITVHLLCSKSRVAPLKGTSLPRLELCGGVLLARLANKIKNQINLTFNRCYYWTDSTIALAWLKSPSKNWKTFIANRVAEIQELTQTKEWMHVPTNDNPADIVSRGCSSTLLKDNLPWWNGPQWLIKDSSYWPQIQNLDKQLESPILNTERRKLCHKIVLIENINDVFNKFSSFNKLRRIIAWCNRFIHNCHHSKNKISESLTVNEIEEAEIHIIKSIQKQYFNKEISELRCNKTVSKGSRLTSLCPFLDDKEILRVGGRLHNAPIPFNTKHPILLPRGHHITNIIIRGEHLRQLHAGIQTTLAAIRQKYWLLAGKSSVRKIIHNCVKCFRAKPVSSEYLMGNLPIHRVEAARPFIHSGVDYVKPVLIKDRQGRGSRNIKAYIALFICFSTKACHIELVGDLTTESFLNCLKRFMARRGKVSHLYSDNATNFVGANNELRKIHDLFSSQVFKSNIIDHLTTENISWHFIPPRSPHFGGLWEAGIKSIKNHLKRVIGNAILTYEQMYTVLTLIESCLNSRPITPLSNDPNDLNVITPGHFLIGAPLTTTVVPDLTTLPSNRLSQWQRVEQLQQHFWKRWTKEYLTQLQQRNK